MVTTNVWVTSQKLNKKYFKNMYNLNGFAFKYEANLHPFQTYP